MKSADHPDIPTTTPPENRDDFFLARWSKVVRWFKNQIRSEVLDFHRISAEQVACHSQSPLDILPSPVNLCHWGSSIQ
jgi:hypothetical protein